MDDEGLAQRLLQLIGRGRFMLEPAITEAGKSSEAEFSVHSKAAKETGCHLLGKCAS